MARRKQYSEDNLVKALDAVENGLSLKKASETFKVPRMTLSDKFHCKTPIGARSGPKTIFTNEEETIIVSWMLEVAKCGFPVTKTQLLDSVQLLDLGRETPFPEGRLRRHWFETFLNRNTAILLNYVSTFFS